MHGDILHLSTMECLVFGPLDYFSNEHDISLNDLFYYIEDHKCDDLLEELYYSAPVCYYCASEDLDKSMLDNVYISTL